MTHFDPLQGTDESEWTAWPAPASWPELTAASLGGGTVVVLAAHPDDEVLGVGGLIAQLAAVGTTLRFVWATDGEASHPHSTAPAVSTMAATRRAESVAALDRLGAGAASRYWLALPDGGLAAAEDELVRRLRALTATDEVVLAPYSRDGHPDHEVCGRAARATGARVVEYPVWLWTWATPDDERVPWNRCRRVPLPAAVRTRKAAAVACFASQVQPLGPEPADAPVLPAVMLASFDRDHETVLV